MAAEAKEAGAQRVSLVHGGKLLMGNEAFHNVVYKRLKKLGVDITLDQHAEFVSSSVGTSMDTRLKCGHGGPGQYRIGDLTRVFGMAFNCSGFRPAHASFVGPLGSSVQKSSWCMDVNSSFQVNFTYTQTLQPDWLAGNDISRWL
jgi:hypothetical protein